ncbi:hypothetical protein [Paenibacillus physcomitrellae]|nr:hypothetical protein [Paenibacillus physcomitrellae]
MDFHIFNYISLVQLSCGFKRVMYTAAVVLLFAGLFLAAHDGDPDG